MMNTAVLIPARYAASRFPGKLLEDLGGKPVILRTYESVLHTGITCEIYVVTDDKRIRDVIIDNGGKVLMPEGNFSNGSERIAAASQNITADIIINVQGDEPFVSGDLLHKMVEELQRDTGHKTDVVSAVFELQKPEEIDNPDNVKVVLDKDHFALYFSRRAIPFPAGEITAKYYQHIGIYAFRRASLLRFATLPPCRLEKTEKLENLRFLYYGMKVKMLVSKEKSIGIDSPEDLIKARKRFSSQ